MSIITIAYYIMCGWVAALLVANLKDTKNELQNFALYLLVLIPIILRLCRVN